MSTGASRRCLPSSVAGRVGSGTSHRSKQPTAGTGAVRRVQGAHEASRRRAAGHQDAPRRRAICASLVMASHSSRMMSLCLLLGGVGGTRMGRWRGVQNAMIQLVLHSGLPHTVFGGRLYRTLYSVTPPSENQTGDRRLDSKLGVHCCRAMMHKVSELPPSATVMQRYRRVSTSLHQPYLGCSRRPRLRCRRAGGCVAWRRTEQGRGTTDDSMWYECAPTGECNACHVSAW